VERDEQGKLLRFFGETLTEGAKGERESLIHFRIARLDADADRQKLIGGLARTLNDVCACVTDWQAMRARVEQAIKTFNSNPPPLPIDEVAEANQFLQWLCADNFTLLGLREYRFSSVSDASDEISRLQRRKGIELRDDRRRIGHTGLDPTSPPTPRVSRRVMQSNGFQVAHPS
jgi:glutamate dehydrogenase